MPPLARLLSELQRVASPETDAELLARFVRRRDEAAFAALVDRHGPMVLRVCRRVLGDVHLAEDVLQATFLVLARKAGTLRRPQALAGWLYGVAQRMAFKARHADRRLRRCTQHDERCDPAGDPLAALTARELLVVLEEELQRLPAPHRMAVVACCLEGNSRDEAAALLGCTTGALRGWLERGRTRLHERLVKRGITLTAALAAAEAAHGSVNAAVIARAVGAAIGTASGAVMRLAGASPLMRLPLMLVAALMLGGAALALIYTDDPPRDDKQPVPPPRPAHVDVRGDPLPPEVIARVGSARLRTGGRILGLRYSADGKSIYSVSDTGAIQRWDRTTGEVNWRIQAEIGRVAALAVGGKLVHILSNDNWPYGPKTAQVTYQALDAHTGKEIRRFALEADDDIHAIQLAPDGATAAIASFGEKPVRLVELASGKQKRRWQLDGSNYGLAFTADDKTLAIGGGGGWIRLFDAATGEKRAELKTPLRRVTRVSIAPDGTRLLAAGSFEKPVILWDLRQHKEVCRIEELGLRDVRCAAFSPNSRYVAIGSTHIGIHRRLRSGGRQGGPSAARRRGMVRGVDVFRRQQDAPDRQRDGRNQPVGCPDRRARRSLRVSRGAIRAAPLRRG